MVPFPVYHYVSGHSGVLKDVPGTSMLSPAHFAILLLLYSSWRLRSLVGDLLPMFSQMFHCIWPPELPRNNLRGLFYCWNYLNLLGGRRVVSSEHTCMWIGVDDGVSWREWIRRFILENWARATATRPTLFLTFVICKKREKKQNTRNLVYKVFFQNIQHSEPLIISMKSSTGNPWRTLDHFDISDMI